MDNPSSELTPQALMIKLKSRGFFDKIRKQYLDEINSKPDYKHLTKNVDSFVADFIERQPCPPKMAKLELRERLRRELSGANFFQQSLNRIVDGVLTSKSTASLVPSTLELVVCESLDVDIEDWANHKKQSALIGQLPPPPPPMHPSKLSVPPPPLLPTQFPFPPINLFTAPPPRAPLLVPSLCPAFLGDLIHNPPPAPISVALPAAADQLSASVSYFAS